MRIGPPILLPFSKRMVTTTGAAPPTTKPRPPFGSPTCIRYKREGYQPDRDLILALTADEEGGGPFNGVDWLLKNHRELIDADFALNEGGRGEMLHGKRISNDIGLAEKTYADFRFEVRNKGGHSSRPVPDNAIYHLAAALTKLSEYSFPLAGE